MMKLKVLAGSIFILFSTQWTAQASFFEGFEIQAGLELPHQVGFRGKVSLFEKMFATVGVGFAPSFMTDMGSGITGGTGILGSNTAELVSDAIQNSFLIDLRAGYSFSGDEGFYVSGGYTLFTGGGGETDDETIEGALDEDSFYLGNNAEVDIASTVHAITVQVGYVYVLNESWSIVGEAGIVKPISSSNELTFGSNVSSVQRDRTEEDVDDHLTDVYLSQMFIPTANVWISYLF